MSWLFTCIRRLVGVSIIIAAAVLAAGAHPAGAQSLETAIMPGPVIQGHAKLESACKNCHVRLDRGAQPRLCLDCHKHVASDVRTGTGYHGRIRERECRICHTEHKGRNAKIVVLAEKTFDHSRTDFTLRGKHAGTPCMSCHRAGTKHSAAPSDCLACHRKDDRHKGSLGAKCANCHDERSWKETRFDHSKTRFPLLNRHAKARCADCHVDQRFAGASRDCVSCHRKDDAHKGRFGPGCGKCHDDTQWKSPTFRHASDTHFPLRGRHQTIKCEACHREPVAQAKTPANCYACHRKDDAHKGSLGEKCESCHAETKWKDPARFDHDRDTRFPLRDKHRDARCDSCHKDLRFREKLASACFDCHQRDDREKGHRGRYGENCKSCHAEKAWKAVIFVHDRDTRFALRGKHLQVKCDSCHKGSLYRDKIDDRCVACHEGDDKHKMQLGKQCERCHNERNWRDAPFDHNQSRFPLRGRHDGLECRKCHLTPAFKDAKPECASCHAKDDHHKERLGPRCEQCHNVRGWKTWDFDHNLRSRFKLTGAHVKAKCYACHTAPVRDKLVLASDCASCHAKKDDIHFGSYGAQCERCHVADNWRKIIKQDRAGPAAPSSATGRPQ